VIDIFKRSAATITLPVLGCVASSVSAAPVVLSRQACSGLNCIPPVTDDCVHTLTPVVSPVTATAKSLSYAEEADAEGEEERLVDGDADAEELGLVLTDFDADSLDEILADGVPSEAEAEIEPETLAEIELLGLPEIELLGDAETLAEIDVLGDADTLADTDDEAE